VIVAPVVSVALIGAPCSSAAEHAADRAHELVDARLCAIGARHADACVPVQKPESDLVERRVDRGDLRDDVDAVAIVLDHPGDPVHLPVDAGEAGEELVVARAVTGLLAIVLNLVRLRPGAGRSQRATPSAAVQPSESSSPLVAWNVLENAPSYITRDGP
jgi:hypothetical protein